MQTPEETLRSGAGSCRDTAWLLVQILRHLGLPARFVSGYLIQLRPDVKPLDGAAGAAQDFTDLHAWTEVYLPGAGWIGLDPTSGLLCGEGHLPLAATPHYRSAAPISGAVEPSEVMFSFDMNVTRIAEKPRVTLPFSDEAWNALDALGEQVDADLARARRAPHHGRRADLRFGRRLSVGGMEHRRARPDQAHARRQPDPPPARSLRARAACCITARANGIRASRCRAGPSRCTGAATACRSGATQPDRARGGAAARRRADDAQRFTERIAARLGIAADYVQPAFEDPADRMLKEGELPENIDPSDPKIDDPGERARILRAVRARI